jgi:hypothetical protein
MQAGPLAPSVLTEPRYSCSLSASGTPVLASKLNMNVLVPGSIGVTFVVKWFFPL